MLNIDIVQILLHVLNFVILAGGLFILLFNPVQKFIKDRQDDIEDREKKISEAEQENEKLRAEYERKLTEADEEISEKKKAVDKELAETSAQYMQQAEEKAKAIISAAENEAEERKAHILDSAQTEISELVLNATSKLLSDTVTPERNTELYDEFIRLTDEKIAEERASNVK